MEMMESDHLEKGGKRNSIFNVQREPVCGGEVIFEL